MAWVTQRTWVAAETVTASQLNVMVRDDLNFLYGEKPACRAYHSSPQSLPIIIATMYSNFDTTLFDTDGIHGQTTRADVGPKGGFTFQTAGKYWVSTNMAFLGDAAHNDPVALEIRTLADEIIAAKVNPNPGTFGFAYLDVQTVWNFAVGEGVCVAVRSIPGDSGTLPADADGVSLSAQWMGN